MYRLLWSRVASGCCPCRSTWSAVASSSSQAMSSSSRDEVQLSGPLSNHPWQALVHDAHPPRRQGTLWLVDGSACWGERRRCSRSKRVLRRNCCCVEKDVHVCMHQYKMESDRLFTFTLCVLEKDVQVACISTKWNLSSIIIQSLSQPGPTRSDSYNTSGRSPYGTAGTGVR